MNEISFIYKKNDYQYLKMDTKILENKSIQIDKDQVYENIVIDKDTNLKNLTVGLDDICKDSKYINLNPDNLSLKELYYSIFNKKWNIPKNNIERRLSVLVKIFNHMLSNKDNFSNILKNLTENEHTYNNMIEEEEYDNKEDSSLVSNLEMDELRYSMKKEIVAELTHCIKYDIFPDLEGKIMENLNNKKKAGNFNYALFISNIVISFGIVIFYDLYKFEI